MSEGIRVLHSQWESAGESDFGFLSKTSSGQEGEVGWTGASGTSHNPSHTQRAPRGPEALPCHRHRLIMK